LADIHLLVLDAGRPTPTLPRELGQRINPSNTIVVLNKVDLLGDRKRPVATVPLGFPSAAISALSGEGVETLLAEVVRLADAMQKTVGDERIAINVRHAHYLSEAYICISSALANIQGFGPVELLASDLRGALAALGEISGKVDNERVLDHLFASFCIGK
jgi:tRNA modification GTPase